MTQETPAVYFASLTIENIKCFKKKETIDLSDGNGKPAMWTVILGNNNTGKTTLLRCLADLEPEIVNESTSKETYYSPIIRGSKFLNEEYLEAASIKSKWFVNGCYEKSLNWEFKQLNTHSPIPSIIPPDRPFISAAISTRSGLRDRWLGAIKIYGYGTNRRAGKKYLSEIENPDNSASLFSDKVTLLNSEEWLLQTDYASKNGIESAKFRLDKIKRMLTSGILPDVKNFKCVSQEINNQISNFVECETDYGWVRLHDLGYGYQSMTAWIVDLAQKMFERYPKSENPLHEPAIVLIDEIDLHLHPEWQRNIIKYLSDLFPKTQFIVTAHSPLIVQSAENINLVILKKQDDHVVINQPDLKTYKGWTVEEILSDLMGLDDRILSDDYLQSQEKFDNALDNDNYTQAKEAYGELVKILPAGSHQPKLLRLQMSSLMPN